MSKIISFGVFVLSGLLISEQAQSQDFLKSAELKQFYAGRIIDTVGRDGVPMVQHFKADGSLTTEFDRPGNKHSWTTKWWVEEPDKICFDNMKGRTFCNKIQKTADGYKRFNPRGGEIPSFWKPRL